MSGTGGSPGHGQAAALDMEYDGGEGVDYGEL